MKKTFCFSVSFILLSFISAISQSNYQRYYQLTNAAELSTMSADFATAASVISHIL